MNIHIYDYLNKNKKFKFKSEDFTSISVNLNIDNFSSCTLGFSNNPIINDKDIRAFDNIYIEDDDGNIIFGGIISGYSINAKNGQFNCLDHRWIFTRLIIDEAIVLTSSENVLDVVDTLIAVAKSKRNIPVEFSREDSAINTDYKADLRFEIGDDIGGSIQKIVQTLYARWVVKYTINENAIDGKLIIRSITGVTPQGIGISHTDFSTEDGEVVTLFYGEGNNNSNLADYTFVFDLQNYASRSKIGVKIDNISKFYVADPDTTSRGGEYFFGRTENFSTDYTANSPETALVLSTLNQVYPRQDLDCLLEPNFKTQINIGDRVNIVIDSPLLNAARQTLTARIDSIQYNYKDGYMERRLFANTMSPQKRLGATGMIEAVANMKQKLDALDQSYFNSPNS